MYQTHHAATALHCNCNTHHSIKFPEIVKTKLLFMDESPRIWCQMVYSTLCFTGNFLTNIAGLLLGNGDTLCMVWLVSENSSPENILNWVKPHKIADLNIPVPCMSRTKVW